MKSIFVIILILFSSQLIAQVSGKSKPGKLFFKKKEVQEIKNPTINLIEPKIVDGKFTTSKSFLTIRGSIEDEYGIEKVTINNEKIAVVSVNNFYHDISLNQGSNNVFIEVVNNRGGKSSKKITIVYNIQKKLLPKIVLTEPFLNAQSEYITEDDQILIKGIIENSNNVRSAFINNIPLIISPQGDLQFTF